MSEREKFTTTLDGELLRRIKILAINRRCSANTLIEEAIKEHLAKYEKESPSWGSYSKKDSPSLAVHENPQEYDKKSRE